MSVVKIYCEICTALIATADTETLAIPISGGMFGPPYPGRMEAPIIPDAEWEFIRCPVCGFRPFLKDDTVMTDAGLQKIPKEKHICEVCGKEFDRDAQLRGHMISHKRKKD